MRVGIPRGLYYYDEFVQWQTFFEALGAEVVTSPPTSKPLMEEGIKHSVDDTCLPVKVFLGHVCALKDEVDYLFIPRLVSTDRRGYYCAKFVGLPDVVKSAVKDLPPLLQVEMDAGDCRKLLPRTLTAVGKALGKGAAATERAYQAGGEALRQAKARRWQAAPQARQGGRRIAVLGHSYIVDDPYVSKDLAGKLTALGAQVVTAADVPEARINQEVLAYLPQIYWALERRLLGAALHYLNTACVDGMVFVTAFACGPDALVGEVVEREARRREKVPFMLLTLDEHTGEAGLETRLEAFMDMVEWREKQCS